MNAGDAADQVIRQVEKMIKNHERASRDFRFGKVKYHVFHQERFGHFVRCHFRSCFPSAWVQIVPNPSHASNGANHVDNLAKNSGRSHHQTDCRRLEYGALTKPFSFICELWPSCSVICMCSVPEILHGGACLGDGLNLVRAPPWHMQCNYVEY